MLSCKITYNQHFKGRAEEQDRLRALASTGQAKLVVVYGRRRVGKTELIEQTLADRRLLKFEGLERQSKSKQLAHFANTLASYLQEPIIAKTKFSSWIEAFQFLAKHIAHGEWTLYLEELQWLANYQNELVSAFKHVWDNQLRHNRDLLVVMCGSAPSFMIGKVLRSSALYNRTEENFPVYPLQLPAVRDFFGDSYGTFEVMDALLTVGAIPPYLERLKAGPSVLIALARDSFTPTGYFVDEYERIFTSSMGERREYRKALEFLAKRSFATKQEIARALKMTIGGGLTSLIRDLEETGFVTSYTPVGTSDDSRVRRFYLSDPYIRFYQTFIRPIAGQIRRGQFERSPLRALDSSLWNTWLGLGFERWVRQHSVILARLLGFEDVLYTSGAYFSRTTPGVQIDLVYERSDKVTTIVEIKYTRKPVGPEVVAPFQKRCALYPVTSQSVRKVLVSASGGTPALTRLGVFDRIVTLEDLIDTRWW